MTTTELDAHAKPVDLVIDGMTCAACAARIERKLNKKDGVTATVNFATKRATVTRQTDIGTDELIDIVRAAGYRASLPVQRAVSTEDAETSALRLRFLTAAFLGLPVMALAMVPMLQFPTWQWVSLALASTVVWVCGWPFHRSALTNLRHGSTTMDTLVSMGVTVSYLWSVYALVLGGAGMIGMRHEFTLALVPSARADSYLEVAVGVVAFLLLGRWLESRAKRKAGAAMHALLALAAKDVVVVRDGSETRIPIGDLCVGDKFVVRPGEKIATDGTVNAGHSTVDKSLLTGESMPQEVGIGDTLVGGTINVSGRLIATATKVGTDTQLAQLTKLVQQAQAGKAKVQRLADRISAIFVPLVLGVAVLTLASWLFAGRPLEFAMTAAVAVMVIACPCALGLATPTALLVGTGRGAQLGILVKGPEVLESTRKVDTIVLDKTGTVTTGQMSVVKVHTASGTTQAELLRFAGAVESASEHPVAAAVVRAAVAELGADLDEVTQFHNHAGLGVSGLVSGHNVLAGQVKILDDLALPADLDLAYQDLRSQGRSIVVVAWDDEVRGLLAVADTVRPSSAFAIQQFRQLGLRPMLLTGDNAATANQVAAEVGICNEDVIADVLPKDKARVIRELREQGRIVAMVGDGVNDAAALASADLGLAMGTGTDAAIEASDLTLIRGDLLGAVAAIRLSRRTLTVIKGNVFWAFAYNIAGIPLAALGMLNPMLAGAAMAFSSVFVVSNSLRLRRFNP